MAGVAGAPPQQAGASMVCRQRSTTQQRLRQGVGRLVHSSNPQHLSKQNLLSAISSRAPVVQRGGLRLNRLAAVVVAAAAAALDAGGPLPQEQAAEQAPRGVVAFACAAMLLASMHRVAFSLLALPIQQQLGLSLPQMGQLHAALLVGYVAGQLPSGALADRVGGARLLVTALAVWSLACLLFTAVPASADPFLALLVARAALGLGQSCLMPASSALSARWFPGPHRASLTSTVYSFFSIGTVLGLALTPPVARLLGWPGAFAAYGATGVGVAALSTLALPQEGRSRAAAAAAAAAAAVMPQRANTPGSGGGGSSKPSSGSTSSSGGRLGVVGQLVLLSFTHSVIGWGFFIMQSWMPAYLSSLGSQHQQQQLGLVGVASALPWLATALASYAAGPAADWLQAARGWSALRVRRLMQALASGGTAVSLLPLALPGVTLPPEAAVAALTAALAFQGCNYSGFHSYVQEVAPRDAGLVLGITNTAGTLVGIVGNLITGWVAGGQLGYAGVFAATAGLHAAGAVAWLAFAHGQQLQLASAP